GSKDAGAKKTGRRQMRPYSFRPIERSAILEFLGCGQVLPDFAVRLYLEDAAFIRVEKIISDGDAVGVGGLHRATSPARRTDAAAVLLLLRNNLKPVIHAVLDAGRPSGY